MMTRARFIGIDWGTTHRRAEWLGEGGQLLAHVHDGQGVLGAGGRFAESLTALLAQGPVADDAPIVMAGTIGSASGWQEVAYLDAATPLVELGRRLVPLREAPRERCFIVPGVRWRDERGRVDVMRGEETQLLGALALLGAEADGWYVLPGTHSKWVRLKAGVVTALRSYLSGELFALLAERGTLAPLMRGEAFDDTMFERGVEELGDEALSHALFGARARVVTGTMPASSARAFVSGLLIGAEWRDAARQPLDAPLRIIGEPALARLHLRCARRAGVDALALDVREVQLAAWNALMISMNAR
jgi:2-dehydro-3-deoxygalactonokinase